MPWERRGVPRMTEAVQAVLDRIQRAIAGLAGRVEEHLLSAVKSVEMRDANLARRVHDDDATIDRLEVEIEEECLRILETFQPKADELRLVIAVLKINHDLEAISDLAVTIADRAEFLAEHAPVPPPFPLEGMARAAFQMLRGALDALVAKNAKQAREVIVRDDEVDEMHRQAYRDVEREIRQNNEVVERMIQWLSVARNLERVADLASAIARDVVYLVEGRIVRHRSVEGAPKS
jgi:phosphate transport system protein